MHRKRRLPLGVAATAALATALGMTLAAGAPAQASVPQLTRYPYLTDVVNAGSTDNATVNFGTDQTITAA